MKNFIYPCKVIVYRRQIKLTIQTAGGEKDFIKDSGVNPGSFLSYLFAGSDSSQPKVYRGYCTHDFLIDSRDPLESQGEWKLYVSDYSLTEAVLRADPLQCRPAIIIEFEDGMICKFSRLSWTEIFDCDDYLEFKRWKATVQRKFHKI